MFILYTTANYNFFSVLQKVNHALVEAHISENNFLRELILNNDRAAFPNFSFLASARLAIGKRKRSRERWWKPRTW